MTKAERERFDSMDIYCVECTRDRDGRIKLCREHAAEFRNLLKYGSGTPMEVRGESD